MNPFEEQRERIEDARFECRALFEKYGHLPAEERVGAKFSSSTLAVLKGMYADMQEADNFLDQWLPKMADLLGVPDTDTDNDEKKGLQESVKDNIPTISSQPDGSRALADKARRQRKMLDDQKRRAR